MQARKLMVHHGDEDAAHACLARLMYTSLEGPPLERKAAVNTSLTLYRSPSLAPPPGRVFPYCIEPLPRHVTTAAWNPTIASTICLG